MILNLDCREGDNQWASNRDQGAIFIAPEAQQGAPIGSTGKINIKEQYILPEKLGKGRKLVLQVRLRSRSNIRCSRSSARSSNWFTGKINIKEQYYMPEKLSKGRQLVLQVKLRSRSHIYYLRSSARGANWFYR